MEKMKIWSIEITELGFQNIQNGIRHYLNLTLHLSSLKPKEDGIGEENTHEHNFSRPFSRFGC
jgi:hypothetical protein